MRACINDDPPGIDEQYWYGKSEYDKGINRFDTDDCDKAKKSFDDVIDYYIKAKPSTENPSGQLDLVEEVANMHESLRRHHHKFSSK